MSERGFSSIQKADVSGSRRRGLAMPAPRIRRSLTPRKSKPDLRRRVQHLTFVRQLPCVACGKAAPSEAAHVRTGTDGGVAVKPGDRYAVPLCAACHAKQHRIGELTFWSALRIDPINGRCGCGRYRRISRPESALCFARDNKSIWQSRSVERGQLIIWIDRFRSALALALLSIARLEHLVLPSH